MGCFISPDTASGLFLCGANMEKKKPTVKLLGEDGNAFAILGRVNRALNSAGLSEEAKAFMKEATSGNYDHLLATVCKYVNVK